MGSIFYMERNGQRYAYESTSRRVPGRKNPVTEKVYLGKVDPETGRIVPKEPRSRPRVEYAKFYGNVCVLDHIQKELGILDDLEAVYPDIGGNIMGAAMSQVIDPSSFDDVHYVVDGSIIRERLKLRDSLSPAAMSDLSLSAGEDLWSMDRFFERRIARSPNGSYALDLTSISTYSKMNGWAEWGHNRDGEGMKQINVAMVTNAEGVPMMFRMLPGSAADMAVLQGLVADMEGLGCRSERLVMDRGFESAANVRALLDIGVPFVVPSNAKAEPVKKLMTRAIRDLRDSSSYRMHEGSPYKTAEYELGIVENDAGGYEYIVRAGRNEKGSAENNERYEGAKKLRAFVVYGPKKASGDIGGMMSAVAETELKLEGTRHRDPEKVYQKLPAFIRKYVDHSVDDDGTMHIQRKQNAFTFADNRAGMFVMLASEGTAWEQMMDSYDIRDWVEKAFDVYKNDLDTGRTRTGDPGRARGRLLIKFIALIMRIRMQNVLRDHEREVMAGDAVKDQVCGMTVEAVIRSLNTLMAIGSTGDWRLTAVTKTNREIFRLFGLEEPKGGCVIIG